MGVQTYKDVDVFSLYDENIETLKKVAKEEYLEEYFLISSCDKVTTENTIFSYIFTKYIDVKSCTIGEYVDKKLSGELDLEYKRRKYLNKVKSVTFSWECDDIYDETSCCDWKSIEW